MTSPHKLQLLVGDSDSGVCELVQASLCASGLNIAGIQSGEDAVDFVRRQPADLVLLDFNIAGLSAIEVCWQIRALSPRTRIVMVASVEEDRVRALEAGADDCVTKPFHFRELAARFRAVLRQLDFPGAPRPTRIEAGGLRLDFERRSLWKAGKEVSLSPKEFELLAALMKNEGIPLSRAELLRAAWGPECREAQSLRTYIRRLRGKLEDDPAHPQFLLSEPWMGYRFSSPSKPAPRPNPVSDSRGPAVGFGTLRCRLPRYNHSKLSLIRIDQLREALRANEVSFPHPLPTFERHDRADLQWKLAALYFIRGWSSANIARRYGLEDYRIRQILKAWARRAVEQGYIQYIPPPQVLWTTEQRNPAGAFELPRLPLPAMPPPEIPAGGFGAELRGVGR